MSQLPALPQTVADLIAEYDRKDADMDAAIATFDRAFDAIGMAATVQGTYTESIGSKPCLRASSMRRNLLKSGWKAVYNRLQIDRIASAKDKMLFERTIADPPPLTFENAKATFGDYFTRPRFHILRGLAEAFVDLDPAYKSHSKVRIGVTGLPKRIILRGWGEYHRAWEQDRFRDVVNALATYQGRPHMDWPEWAANPIAGDVEAYSHKWAYARQIAAVLTEAGLSGASQTLPAVYCWMMGYPSGWLERALLSAVQEGLLQLPSPSKRMVMPSSPKSRKQSVAQS